MAPAHIHVSHSFYASGYRFLSLVREDEEMGCTKAMPFSGVQMILYKA